MKTFAEVVSLAKTKKDCIRNIKIISEDPQQIDVIRNKLANNQHCQDIEITSITSKSPDFLTVKCANADEANKMTKTLYDNFGNKLQISEVNESAPKVKIVNVDPRLGDTEFVLSLKEQNHWLRNMNFVVHQRFVVPTANGICTNVILKCDIACLKKFIEHGTVISGFSEKRVYEHVEVLQCFNCQRFGHVASACKASPCCKFCALPHQSSVCEDREATKCINCSKTTKNSNHRASDERCPSRRERINVLKLLVSKN